MTIKVTVPNTSSDSLTFGSANTPTAAQVVGIDSGSSNGQLAFNTTASGTSTERMRIDASGNVGIGGTPDADAKFQVVGSVRAAGGSPAAFNFNNGFTFQNSKDAGMFSPTNGVVGFATGGAERARIDSSGNLLVGGSSVPGTGIVRTSGGSGTVSYTAYSSNTAAYTAFQVVNPNGQVGSIIATGSSTAFNTSSDYRLKEDIAPMINALAKVALLKPVTYKWKVDGTNGQGFIAHELAEVEAGCVSGEKDAVDVDGTPVYQGIDTSFLVATLTAAIQEQQALITTLTERITALEAK